MSTENSAAKQKPKLRTKLQDAEKLLKAVILEASGVGLYDVVGSASRIAGDVAMLISSLDLPAAASVRTSLSPQASKASASDQMTGKRAADVGKGRQRVAPPVGYQIANDVLIRSGLSRTGHGTYAHKVPRAVFEQIADAMAALARETADPVTVETISSRLRKGGTEPPTYQVYGTVSFLRSRRCIVQEGRAGYLITQSIGEVARRAWNELATKAVRPN